MLVLSQIVKPSCLSVNLLGHHLLQEAFLDPFPLLGEISVWKPDSLCTNTDESAFPQGSGKCLITNQQANSGLSQGHTKHP